jgi:hypothetical protein
MSPVEALPFVPAVVPPPSSLAKSGSVRVTADDLDGVAGNAQASSQDASDGSQANASDVLIVYVRFL